MSRSSLAIAGMSILLASGAIADTVVLTSVKDATLISDSSAEFALGAAYNIYAGRVGENGLGTLRRGALQFDLSSIPQGSVVSGVQLKLYLSASQTTTQTVTLNKMLMSWGEGASFAFGGGGALAQPGDATWIHRFYPNDPWPVPGGNFSSTVSASRSVAGVAWYTWGSTPQLVADVQGWLGSPSSNFGWALLGNEVTLQAVKRFDAREAGATAPQLIVTYAPPTSNPSDLNNDGVVNATDLAILLAAWSTANSIADINHDGIVDGTDLSALLAGW